ncbi:SRPBCC domain-containing protein [Psychroserpens sp. SPM9]|uniref:SRPBCC family protein n=1 Tax=Psychroserpens sp. SPM9 TaxID=2975598 RepID=UPI0021A7A52C|nr:SRPBCC domain-containing protein [Psychroserpens sp. SPM9]MDG5492384.1 SRPBCC domain-containing protein [Psychroserpens sp. SPM9]
MKVSEPVIIVREVFNHPKERVWNALTKLDEMTQWSFDNIPEFKAVEGFKTQFTVTSEDRAFPHIWEIIDVIPYQKIVYNWSYEGYKGDSQVSVDKQTQLTLTTTVTEDFPDDIPEFKRESCVAGWNYFIKDRLKSYLHT